MHAVQEIRGSSGLEEGDRLSGLMANINGGTRGSNIGKVSALINRNKLTPAYLIIRNLLQMLGVSTICTVM